MSDNINEHIFEFVNIDRRVREENVSHFCALIKILGPDPDKSNSLGDDLVKLFASLCDLNFDRLIGDMNMIVVEGNVGSGKSTFLKFFADLPQDEFVIIDEPIDLWQTVRAKSPNDSQFKDSLAFFYNEIQKRTTTFAFKFEIIALFTKFLKIQQRLGQLAESNINPKAILCERSIISDRWVFLDNLKCKISQKCLDIYVKCYEICLNKMKCLNLRYFYLKIDPAECLERVRLRKRPGEEAISLAYVIQIEKKYSEMKKFTSNIEHEHFWREIQCDPDEYFRLYLEYCRNLNLKPMLFS